MIKGIGVDAANIERFSNASEGLISRFLSEQELAEYRALSDSSQNVKSSFLASRFAVKEAYAKARGTGFGKDVSPVEITTLHDSLGRPSIALSGKTLETDSKSVIHVSLTHENPLAIAMVILEDVTGEADGKN